MSESPTAMPNLFVIGAQKAGTSSLHLLLDSHPQIGMSRIKEPRYWALREPKQVYTGPGDPARRIRCGDRASYLAMFEHADSEVRWVGESSTLYLHSPQALENIARHCDPNLRIIVVLREPLARAHSAFVYARKIGREPLPTFRDAVDAEQDRRAAGWGPLWWYRTRSLYADPLRRVVRLFGRKQVLGLRSDELSDHSATTCRLSEFLDVDAALFGAATPQTNRGGIPRSLLLQRVLYRGVRPALRRAPYSVRQGITDAVERLNLTTAPALGTEAFPDLQHRFERDLAELVDLGFDAPRSA